MKPEKFVALVKGLLNVALGFDSYQVLLSVALGPDSSEILLELRLGTLRNSSGNSVLF